MRHGEAVAIGMAMIARAAAARGLLAEKDCGEILSLLEDYGLPTRTEIPAPALLEALKQDKKRGGDSLRLIVPRRIGRCEIRSVSMDEAADWLRDGGAL